MSFLVETSPGAVIKPHFHRVDQWQLFIGGSASFGRHAIAPVSLHFAGAYSPYGPIRAGENGIAFFTLRNRFDWGTAYMPEFRKELWENRRLFREVKIDCVAPAVLDRFSAATASTEIILTPEKDGLAAWRLILPPGSSAVGPAPAGGHGQSWVVISGAIEHGSKSLATKSCLFVFPDEAAFTFTSAEGAEVWCLQYPKPS